MSNQIVQIIKTHWTSAVEVLVMAFVLYYGYLYFRGTRGAKVLTGLALLFLFLTLISQLLSLQVISWLIEKFSVFLAIALVVIFQPELRRALAELGSHHFFATTTQKRETIQLIADAVFELSHKQWGALLAIERETGIRVFAESGVNLDAEFSQELLLSIFHPKTALHDGGVIIQNDRLHAAACIFPVTQKENLDRSLGLRHRAAIGITEESDAVAIVVSEETGGVSIASGGRLERNLTPETFRKRLGQLLLLEKYEKGAAEQLESEADLPGPGGSALVSDQKKSLDDRASV
jgi:diadenylate cyclase